jgi:hypothetical protein
MYLAGNIPKADRVVVVAHVRRDWHRAVLRPCISSTSPPTRSTTPSIATSLKLADTATFSMGSWRTERTCSDDLRHRRNVGVGWT